MAPVKLTSPGPGISDAEIESLKLDVGRAIPSDYVQFLRTHNGGRPSPDVVDLMGASLLSTDVQGFFGIGRDIETLNLAWWLDHFRDDLGIDFLLPFACDSFGNLFCFDFESESGHEIVFCDRSQRDVARLSYLADDFNAFLALLRPFES